MKELTKDEMKKIMGGTEEIINPGDGSDAEMNCAGYFCLQGCPEGCKCEIACTRCTAKK